MTTTPRPGVFAAAVNLKWMAAAACAGQWDLFFGPEDEGTVEQQDREREAKKICGGCPVTVQCLQYRSTLPPQSRRYGVFGGTGEHDWQRLIRLRALQRRREREEKAA